MSEEEIQIENEEDTDELYVEYDISTYPSDFTLKGISDMWDEGEITIPPFQRKFVWTIKQSSLLIESFLLGLPVPQLFLYVDDDHKNLVIDGQQRILSIIYFFEGFFGEENPKGKRQVFRLTGLSEESPFHRKRFDDLSETYQRKLKSTVLRAINIRQMAPADDKTSMFHIFERLNTGGTPLRPQEIRNCVFLGKIVELLNDLNTDENWRLILGRKAPDKHQRDVEMILRIFAMSYYGDDYEKPMKKFLNDAMQRNKNASTKEIKLFAKWFPEITKSIVEHAGEKPFHVRGPINLAAMDSVFPLLIQNPDVAAKGLGDILKGLYSNEDYQSSIYYNTSDAATVEDRREIAADYLVP